MNSSYWSRISSRRCEPAVGQVARQAADAAVGVGDARAGERGEVLVDVVADHHEVEERRHRAQLHQRGRDAGEVIGDARVFGQQRAQVAAARRDLDAHQLLDRLAVGEVVDEPRAVVEAVDVRNEVVPGVGFALLLEAAVQVAAVHVDALDPLAVERGDDLDRAVRGRMRRADVDDDVAVAFVRSNAGRTGFGSALPASFPSCPVGNERLLLPLRIVLAQRMADEALVEQDRAQVGIAAEDDAVHVVAFALHEMRGAVERDQRVDRGIRFGHAVFTRTRTKCFVE